MAHNLSTGKLGGRHMDYGYARVSTREQNEERQFIALRKFGLADKSIYLDKRSGKDLGRYGYKRLLRKIQK